MGIGPKLELRQSQQLVMTPQLLQAIRLLQYSSTELSAFVEAELERNPLLERADGPDGTSAEQDPGSGLDERGEREDGAPAVAAEDAGWMASDLAPGESAMSDAYDSPMENVFPDDHGKTDPVGPPSERWDNVGSRQVGAEDFDLADIMSAQETLADHLMRQLELAEPDGVRRFIGINIIDLIDANGWFAGETGELAERLGADLATVEAVLALIQTFEPTGVGARTLAECLGLQLRERNRLDPAMQALLDHLDCLARRDMKTLMSLCGVDAEDLGEMIGEIRSLNPRPGAGFGVPRLEIVEPDVLVRAAPDGSWLVDLNSENLPRVLVNHAYHARISSKVGGTDKSYVAECLSDAAWLVKSLDQRARTILKVASEIVRQQDAFLIHGVAHLRPLTLKAVADAISMHESTVSRVTANKYMATPRGMFELKFFFTAAIAASDGGDAHSAAAVRHRIKQMIDAESADAILSDDTLVQLLKNEGIDIARRTVAKYREGLKIPSSVQRRREKQAANAFG